MGNVLINNWVVQPLIERVSYRTVLTTNTFALGLMLSSIGTEHTTYLLLGIPAVFGEIKSIQFTAINTTTLVELDDASASSGNSLLSVAALLSLSLGMAYIDALLSAFMGNSSAEK